MKPKRHVCTCLTPATHWCPKTGKQYCQQHAEHYASVFGEESLKTFPADKAKPVINKSSELNAANDRIQSLIEERDRENRLAEWKSFTSGNAQQAFDFARQLERELNAANQRIKRLEEAGDALKAAGYFGGWADAVNNWIKSKEDKP